MSCIAAGILTDMSHMSVSFSIEEHESIVFILYPHFTTQTTATIQCWESAQASHTGSILALDIPDDKERHAVTLLRDD